MINLYQTLANVEIDLRKIEKKLTVNCYSNNSIIKLGELEVFSYLEKLLPIIEYLTPIVKFSPISVIAGFEKTKIGDIKLNIKVLDENMENRDKYLLILSIFALIPINEITLKRENGGLIEISLLVASDKQSVRKNLHELLHFQKILLINTALSFLLEMECLHKTDKEKVEEEFNKRVESILRVQDEIRQDNFKVKIANNKINLN